MAEKTSTEKTSTEKTSTEKTSADKPQIDPRPNGPLLVRGLEHLRNSKGERLETGRAIVLCRCGGSSKKPFCDGTHAKNGFNSENTASRDTDKVERYAGPEVTILDNRFICAHAGTCTEGLESVFRYGKEPWIDPTAAEADQIVEVIQRCPSGALAYARGQQETRDYDREPAITVSQNGPYHVVGAAELKTDAWGEGASREHYALCRCGASKNKPFCDGSHWEAEFKDEAN